MNDEMRLEGVFVPHVRFRIDLVPQWIHASYIKNVPLIALINCGMSVIIYYFYIHRSVDAGILRLTLPILPHALASGSSACSFFVVTDPFSVR